MQILLVFFLKIIWHLNYIEQGCGSSADFPFFNVPETKKKCAEFVSEFFEMQKVFVKIVIQPFFCLSKLSPTSLTKGVSIHKWLPFLHLSNTRLN